MTLQYDIAGQRFGRLVAVRYQPDKKKWECLCDCGNTTSVDGTLLRTGNTKSCGCFNRDLGVARFTTHGKSALPEFGVWAGMKARCYNPNNESYPSYGGRGIRICESWLNGFAVFYADMGDRPGPGWTIERINNDGNYEPANCKWIPRPDQSKNRRGLHLITIAEITHTLAEWSRLSGVKETTLFRRIKTNWPVEELLTTQMYKRIN